MKNLLTGLANIRYRLSERGVPSICSEKAFVLLLQRERARADRGHGTFSLVVFDFHPARDRSSARRLIEVLKGRIRIADSVGWLRNCAIGAILVDTPFAGGQIFLNDVLQSLQGIQPLPECHIYTYPTDAADKRDSPIIAAQAVGTDATDTEIFLNEILAVGPPLRERVAERVLAGIVLFFISPFMLLIAAAIKRSSPGPVLYRQMRVGYKGKEFCCYKFRSMHLNVDTEVHDQYFEELIKADVPMSKLDQKEDPRIFRFGQLLRSSSMDELPQLFNILKGEMSLIGPRPCIPCEYRSYIPWHRHRVDVLPGLTGLWQVSGKNRTTFTEMMRFDLHYVRHRSMWMDIWIIAKTFPVVIRQFMEDRRAGKKLSRSRRAPDADRSLRPLVSAPKMMEEE